MPEATTAKTTAASAAKTTPEFAGMVKEQVLASVKQSQQIALDAVETWTGVMGKVVPQMPGSPLVPASAEMSAALSTSFDLAQELLAAQRSFAESLFSALVPASA